jgi:hypothetical protein
MLLLVHPDTAPEEAAMRFVDGEKGVADVAAALECASWILFEQAAEDAELIGSLRQLLWDRGEWTSTVVPGKEEEGVKFSDYFNASEPLRRVPSHRALALFRGRHEGFLRLNVDLPEVEGAAGPGEPERRIAKRFGIEMRGRAADAWLAETVRWAWKFKILIHLGIDAEQKLRDDAEAEAIRVLWRNLRDLMLAALAEDVDRDRVRSAGHEPHLLRVEPGLPRHGVGALGGRGALHACLPVDRPDGNAVDVLVRSADIRPGHAWNDVGREHADIHLIRARPALEERVAAADMRRSGRRQYHHEKQIPRPARDDTHHRRTFVIHLPQPSPTHDDSVAISTASVADGRNRNPSDSNRWLRSTYEGCAQYTKLSALKNELRASGLWTMKDDHGHCTAANTMMKIRPNAKAITGAGSLNRVSRGSCWRA